MFWYEINLLKRGNQRQQSVYQALTKLALLDKLKSFDATLASTICLAIDTPQSDVDVICCYQDLNIYEEVLISNFAEFENFKFIKDKLPIVLASFESDGLVFEIYADKIPVKEQYAFRHLSIMAKLLDIGGDELRDKVLQLRMEGLKPEASFCKLLNLTGDPFVRLLELENIEPCQIEILLSKI